MNDASKKSLCELLGLGVSAVELLEKRILWGEKKLEREEIGNKREMEDQRGRQRDGERRGICEIRRNREELFLQPCDREGTNEYRWDE